MGLYLASRHARAALEARGQWEQAVRLSAGHHVHIRCETPEGPFVAHDKHRISRVTDPEPLRAIELAIEAAA